MPITHHAHFGCRLSEGPGGCRRAGVVPPVVVGVGTQLELSPLPDGTSTSGAAPFKQGCRAPSRSELKANAVELKTCTAVLVEQGREAPEP